MMLVLVVCGIFVGAVIQGFKEMANGAGVTPVGGRKGAIVVAVLGIVFSAGLIAVGILSGDLSPFIGGGVCLVLSIGMAVGIHRGNY